MARLGVLLFFLSLPVQAITLTNNGCMSLAAWTSDVVLMRDVGADKEKVRAKLKELQKEKPFLKIIIKWFDDLWNSDMTYDDIMKMVYYDCANRGGVFGEDI